MHGRSGPVFMIANVAWDEICENDKNDRCTFGGMIKLIMDVPALGTRARTMSGATIDAVIRCHIPSGRVQALDELLDFPHLNVLFCHVLTHAGRVLIELVSLFFLAIFCVFFGLLRTEGKRGKDWKRNGLYAILTPPDASGLLEGGLIV